MKYHGKEKCRILKQIRAQIAESNDIEWIVEECPHKGDCAGTCPKCEAEVRELERKLEERKKLGKRIAVAGVAAGIALSVSGCSVPGTTMIDGDLVAPSYGGGSTLPALVITDEDTDADTASAGENNPGTDEDGDVDLPGEIPEPDKPTVESPDEILPTAGILLPPDAEIVTGPVGEDDPAKE